MEEGREEARRGRNPEVEGSERSNWNGKEQEIILNLNSFHCRCLSNTNDWNNMISRETTTITFVLSTQPALGSYRWEERRERTKRKRKIP